VGEVDLQGVRALLVEALRLVAATPDEQIAALPTWVAVADEIALVYEDHYLMVPALIEGGLITAGQEEPLKALDALFDQMTDAADREAVWKVEAIYDDERWEKARELARAALQRLGEHPAPPEIDGYVQLS
jgi:hypothetical protein